MNMLLKIVLVQWLLLFFLTSSSQNIEGIKVNEISCSEKWWVIKHPFVAFKVKRITQETRRITVGIKKTNELKGTGNGDQVDAFRHVYWMARLTQEIGPKRARSLGEAHEKGSFQLYKKQRNEDGVLPDKIGSEMDLYNNNVGIALGKENLTINDLTEMVVEAILNGDCKVIKVNEQGDYLNCDGFILTENELKGAWENNKCLINSNEK